jgi:hypothetical protein
MDDLKVTTDNLRENHDKQSVDLVNARNEIDVITQQLKTSKEETVSACNRKNSTELDLVRER